MDGFLEKDEKERKQKQLCGSASPSRRPPTNGSGTNCKKKARPLALAKAGLEAPTEPLQCSPRDSKRARGEAQENMVAYVQLALFLLVTCGIHETEQNHFGCHRLIMASHLKNLTDLIDSQMETSCLRSFEYVDERELGNTECFLKAAYNPLKYIIDNINFTSNTPNYLKLHLIKDLYLDLARCIKPPNDKNKKCIKTFSLTAQQTLQLVHKYFSQAKQFLSKNTFTDDCSGVFQKCSESQEKEIVSPDQLDSRKTAVSILQLLRLPDTTQILSGFESNTRTGESQKRSDEIASQHLPLSDLAKSFLNQQWFEIKEKTEATPGLASDQDITVASSAFSLTLTSSFNLEQIDSSSVPPSGSPHVLGHKDPVSATQDPSNFVVTTENSLPPKQILLGKAKQSSRDSTSKALQNTQLRMRREENLAKDRELEDSLLGPSFDLNFIPPNAEKHTKKSEPRNIQGTSVTYVVIPSVLGILLALGGLLFYLHKSRILRKRQTQQMGNNVERTEEQRSLRKYELHHSL
ncbi:macrophage colony-stimulating factor 1 [Crotalus adamanteus]|uniref:Macrophage colony-stimulating factor 1 n=1 Tax=Crotalus adamanteus TaxID=8729 RepID=A0AAW1BQX2_CROAD